MTPEDKLINVEGQVFAIQERRTNVINCPYCRVQTKQGDTLCCQELVDAMTAVCQRQAVADQLDANDKIFSALMN